jgi:hypothetical protein
VPTNHQQENKKMNTMKKTIMIIAAVGALAQLFMATPAAAEEFFYHQKW